MVYVTVVLALVVAAQVWMYRQIQILYEDDAQQLIYHITLADMMRDREEWESVPGTSHMDQAWANEEWLNTDEGRSYLEWATKKIRLSL
jgi:hypothetical protein